jgi:CHAD domain-containing protein
MRASLALFSAVLPEGLYAGLSDELRWLGAELGDARDLDVFLIETLEPLAARVPGEPALKRFVNEACEMRVDAYRRVRAALDSQRYARLMLTLGSHVASRSWRNQPLSEPGALLFEPARDAGRKLLAGRHRNAIRQGRRLPQRSPAELHRLRIELKKLRYACEFLRGAYPSRGAARYIERVSRLQDVLGHLNDVVNVGHHLSAILDRMGPEVGPEHREAAGFVAGWTARDSEVRLGRLHKRWKSFRKTRRFWKRG